ncbi:PEP_CTERM-anchored TLD domain-containing protein [Massilia yuzhufengensis]|uniref:PEP-CTERM protein-sorting domain-containing protein n=1 Tax=Massilia yuzhufengensis TaxID=1164594 RepID=A0A1I1PAJ6_9BURK|nr:PEP_CTERM-anchored TLD domain-containing protein [Massilia yuzhufengensis]SFD06755.1 PEP-CTERM protein-sorting domain-containing protein [Massilia yuzhufengensis]
MKPILAAGSLAFILAGPAPSAQAQDGASLLDITLYGQLERWLGAGPLDLRNIYTRTDGHNSRDFHAAVDGGGMTFTLLQVSNDIGNSWIIGGYNPQSWSSTDGWHDTPRDWQRTAFIFNYTDPQVWRQVATGNILPSRGMRQTFNEPNHGPTFGAGPDLFVNDRLNAALSWQVSYGDGASEGMSIIDGSTGGQLFRVDALESYSIALVPEPASTAMFAAGLGVVGWAAWRRRVRAAPQR